MIPAKAITGYQILSPTPRAGLFKDQIIDFKVFKKLPMLKGVVFIVLIVLFYSSGVLAQDTLSHAGKQYQLVQGWADTMQNTGGKYIVKYAIVPEMADTMRSNGKIYVVIAVLATIFAGIVAYLVMLDRKIGKLEKDKTNY